MEELLCGMTYELLKICGHKIQVCEPLRGEVLKLPVYRKLLASRQQV